MQQPQHRNDFDPAPYARELARIIEAIEAEPRLDARGLDRILRRHPKDGRGLFARSEVLAGFRRLRPGDPAEAAFAERLRLRPVRSLSGVTPVTVLTRPFPCPGRCIFCPDDARMPKSYLSSEPGCQRAAHNDFDPYRQTWSRLSAFRAIGHPVEKVELIVLGGTWSAYPEAYRVGFVKRCLDALADFGAGLDRRASSARDPRAGWEVLDAAKRANETARVRCVGLSVETRPDHLGPRQLAQLRRLGVTKVQIGVQSLSDAALLQNGRGHDVAATRRAFRLLRGAGFKIQAHWMPNLLGATPASDRADFARLVGDPDFRPDELKIYPCLLVESAELMEFHRRGAWRPYPDAELTSLLADCLEAAPPWCRVTRVVRDFSAGDIVAGTRAANLREVAEQVLRRAGRSCRDIRSREVRGARVRADELALTQLRYATAVGEERFLQWVTRDDRLVGFLRLTLPAEPACAIARRARAASGTRAEQAPQARAARPSRAEWGGPGSARAGTTCLDELGRSALIREVHVYGASLELGRRHPGGAQHRGLGGARVERAARISRQAGFASLAVISAVGTRDWYRRLGFADGALYQHRKLGKSAD